MTDVFYLRPMASPVRPADVIAMSRHAGGCFNLHRVDWVRSFLATDGLRMMCWYRAPDAESARIALRQLGSDMTCVWTGTVQASDEESMSPGESAARVAVEFIFDDPRGSACDSITDTLMAEGLNLDLIIRSTDGTRAVYVLREPDDAIVRQALRRIERSPVSIWGCVAMKLEIDPA